MSRLKSISLDWGFFLGLALMFTGFTRRDPWMFAFGSVIFLRENLEIEVTFR